MSATTSERVYTTIDKSGWGEGEWQTEPDKVQWTDEATGFSCLAKRTGHSGHWCGYVGVPNGHPLYEVAYDDVRVPDEDGDLDWPRVHGGLTYSDKCQEGAEAEAICHVPAPGEPDDVWWLGFDCAHSGDLSPAWAARDRERGFPRFHDGYESYKTLDYVRAETRNLAAQVAATS